MITSTAYATIGAKFSMQSIRNSTTEFKNQMEQLFDSLGKGENWDPRNYRMSAYDMLKEDVEGLSNKVIPLHSFFVNI